MAPRPQCVWCGEPYGQRRLHNEVLVWACDAPVPEQTTPGTAVKLDYHKRAPHPATGTFYGKPYGQTDNCAIRQVWDGTWFTSYSPFCTLRCALDYAQRAWEQGKVPMHRR